MSGADKHFNKSVVRAAASRNVRDENVLRDNNPYYKSQYNDDRDLSNFQREQTHFHQQRTVNAMTEIDPSDSEVFSLSVTAPPHYIGR